MPFLFLDRDGVINVQKPNAYIQDWSEFVFLPGVLESFAALAQYFDRICLVTNQQGIGKGLMTEADLQAIHTQMLQAITAVGGRLDGLYYCPHLASQGCTCRKPQNGLALAAQRDFPEIRWEESYLLGDSLTDIQMGQSLGMHCFYCGQGQVEGAEKISGLAQLLNLLP
jgi:D-glycero-D-manno-heptose 1,7-bisphosphate phosphatase